MQVVFSETNRFVIGGQIEVCEGVQFCTLGGGKGIPNFSALCFLKEASSSSSLDILPIDCEILSLVLRVVTSSQSAVQL